MNIFVAGGAGFIGSHLVDKLVKRGDSVTVYDNLSSGKREFLRPHEGKNNFRFLNNDLLDFDSLSNAVENQDLVFHLAANPDIQRCLENTRLDLEQGTLVTYNVLEAMRLKGVKNIVFTSSSVVYGEPKEIPTPEDYGPLVPISLYGASKLACEGLICAYSHLFDIKAWIFRLANIIGNRMTHGLILDLIEKLKKNSQELEILGDGQQCKSYLLVEECIDAMLWAAEKTHEQINIFNISSQDNIKISKIAQILIKEMGLKGVGYRFTGGKRGWEGDVPLVLMAIDKINKLGWRPKHSSEEAVQIAIRSLICKR